MRLSAPTLLLAGTAFAAGFGLAWQIQANRLPEPLAGSPIAASPLPLSPAPTPTPGFFQPQAPVASAVAARPGPPSAPPPAPATDAESLLRQQAEADPAVLRGLLHRFTGEQNPATRQSMKSVLSSIRHPEVIAFASQLASSGDPALRREGLEMLQHLAPDTPEVRKLLSRTLGTEQSPDILLPTLAALNPAAVPPAEAETLLRNLQQLARHPHPTVRSQSLLQLAQWDKTGSTQTTLTQALADSSPEVRQAAVFALAQSNTRSDSSKTALLQLASNPQEASALRGSALQALERYALSGEEYTQYSQLRTQLLGF